MPHWISFQPSAHHHHFSSQSCVRLRARGNVADHSFRDTRNTRDTLSSEQQLSRNKVHTLSTRRRPERAWWSSERFPSADPHPQHTGTGDGSAVEMLGRSAGDTVACRHRLSVIWHSLRCTQLSVCALGSNAEQQLMCADHESTSDTSVVQSPPKKV